MAGLPDRQFVEDLPGNLFGRFGILVPGDRGWSAVIETALGGRVRRITRYAMEVRKEGFDRRRLEKIAAGLPEGYELRRIDRGCMIYAPLKRGAGTWCPSFRIMRLTGALARALLS